jgi:serine/threonine protein kinase
VVIYEMATGRLPFAGASPSETVTNILDNQPTPITKLSPERPAQLDQIMSRLTAKRADERYETARALLNDLALVTEKLRDGRRKRFFDRLFPDR